MFVVKNKGQSTLEYVILFGFVVAALLAMGVYMKRGFQGRLRESTDQIGEQYSPGQMSGSFTTRVDIDQQEVQTSGGQSVTTINQYKQTRTGQEEASGFDSETWTRH